VVQNDIIEFLGYGFLSLFNSNYRPTTHYLATVHECDQPSYQQCHDTIYRNSA